MLKGSIVALITPFKDDNLDQESYRKIIDYHLKNGTNGIVPGGTTGEHIGARLRNNYDQ